MAKTTNITRYVCDRCSTLQHLAQGDPETSDWHDVSRVTVDGNTVSRLLCKSCYSEYKALVQAQDADFNDFMIRTEEDDA